MIITNALHGIRRNDPKVGRGTSTHRLKVSTRSTCFGNIFYQEPTYLQGYSCNKRSGFKELCNAICKWPLRSVLVCIAYTRFFSCSGGWWFGKSYTREVAARRQAKDSSTSAEGARGRVAEYVVWPGLYWQLSLTSYKPNETAVTVSMEGSISLMSIVFKFDKSEQHSKLDDSKILGSNIFKLWLVLDMSK